MNKYIDALFTTVSVILLLLLIPIQFYRDYHDFIRQKQCAYEADYLAWEIQAFKKIDSAVLPSVAIEFYCYDKNFEMVNTLTSADDLDFASYFCVIFQYNDEKRGIYIE